MIPWFLALTATVIVGATCFAWGQYSHDVYEERDALRTRNKQLNAHLDAQDALLAERGHKP
jgi:hypothetical protein